MKLLIQVVINSSAELSQLNSNSGVFYLNNSIDFIIRPIVDFKGILVGNQATIQQLSECKEDV